MFSCAGAESPDDMDTGGVSSSAGRAVSGGGISSGSGAGSGGATNMPAGGKTTSSGGSSAGTAPTAGQASAGGGMGSGGSGSGGKPAGGSSSGGFGSGGRPPFGGANNGGSAGTGTAGMSGAGTAGAGATTGTAVDCNAAMPSGGTQHSGNSQGGSNNLAWQIWSNQGTGKLTTFSTPAFKAEWSNSGDYLGRMGFEWGNSGKSYDQYGTITAGFTFKKTGSGGGFSYIGIYGWSTNPCVEWYILDDSFGQMPFTPYNSNQKGSATMIDGENYKFYSNSTNGTGGSRCNATSWSQFWSVRQKARQCGTITISEHFKAWDAAGMKLGNLLEAKILVETGGGSGSVDFAVANLEKTK